MQIFLSLFTFLVSALAFANEHGGGEHAASIPTVVYHQALNFFIFVALMVFLLRKAVREYFKAKKEQFQQALLKAEHARKEAEQKKRELERRLNQLTSTADESVARSRGEAEDLKKKIIEEAEALTKNLQIETEKTIRIELERARNQLREELLSLSLVQAGKILREKIKDTDQTRLQTEFVEKIQAEHL